MAKVQITKEMADGYPDVFPDEIFAIFYICPNCKDSHLINWMKFCPNCGIELEFVDKDIDIRSCKW